MVGLCSLFITVAIDNATATAATPNMEAELQDFVVTYSMIVRVSGTGMELLIYRFHSRTICKQVIQLERGREGPRFGSGFMLRVILCVVVLRMSGRPSE